MTTTTIHPGYSVSSILNEPDWGEGYTNAQRQRLNMALIQKFEELIRDATGDASLSYYPYTSEIQYACWGESTQEHGCLSPMRTWLDEDIDWGQLACEAGEWILNNAEHVLARRTR